MCSTTSSCFYNPKRRSRTYAQQRRSSAVKVGELELTSPLVASSVTAGCFSSTSATKTSKTAAQTAP